MTDTDEDSAGYLDEPPEGNPPPPVVTAEHTLPFKDLTWESFEKLCYRLTLYDGEFEARRHFGVRGQRQSGIDLFTRQSNGTYTTYQCKNYERVTPSVIKKAVSEFLKGEWARRSTRFVFCTTASLSRAELVEEVENQVRRLKRRNSPIVFDTWGEDELSDKLRTKRPLVREFFGPHWYDRFFQPATEAELEPVAAERLVTADSVASSDKTYRRARIVHVDWARDKLRERLKRFAEERPEEFDLLSDHIGVPPKPALLASTIDAVPPWLEEADGETWTLVARLAESQGLWEHAATAWTHRAGLAEDEVARADALVSAAIAAGISEDDTRHDQLLADAEQADPTHPRVVLAHIDDNLPGQQLYDALAQVHSDNPPVQAVIEGRRALAALRIPDLDKARAHSTAATEADSGGLTSRAVAVNVTIQKGRLDFLAGMPLDATALRAVHGDALAIRDELVQERRWSESVRMLMLAADTLALLGERSEAAGLLRQAVPEERATPDGAQVLAACAAGRVLDFWLALEFLSEDDMSPASRRLRAEALEEVGTREQRAEALATLDELVQQGGDEAPESALVRLAATLGGRKTPWSDAASDCLVQAGHERAAVSVRVFFLARWHADYEQGMALLDDHAEEMWAKSTRLRLAMTWGKHSVIKCAARELLDAGPSQGLRLEAARALGRCGEFKAARPELMAVARDPSAPLLARAQAYDLLMDIVGRREDDWKMARRLLNEWTKLRPGDERASAWWPTVENRLRRR